MFSTLNTEGIFLALLIAVVAALVHGSVGFGFPMIATPLLSLIMDLQTAIVLTLMPTLIMNIAAIASEGEVAAAFRRYLPLAISAMVGSAVGTQLLLITGSEVFKVILGLAIFLYLAVERVQLHIPLVRSRPRFAMYLFGCMAGILGGLTNVMAPVLIIYFLESGHNKKEIVQAANISFLLGKIVQIVLFWLGGHCTLARFTVSALLTGVAAVAFAGGIVVKKRLDTEVYKKILRVFLFIVALMLFFQYLA